MTLLDLSAAYSAIDHNIFLRRLDDWFGVTGKALAWFKSFLTGILQRIKLGDCLSSKADLQVCCVILSVLRINRVIPL